MSNRKTIVLVLRSGGDFSFRDVELIVYHIQVKWVGEVLPRIILLWDHASERYDLGNIEIIPLTNKYPGTWSRIQLYSPEMDQYRPFLYIDLDTAIIQSIENIFALIKDESQFITLEDFWQPQQLATGLVWFPKESSKVEKIYKSFQGPTGNRMDLYIRRVIQKPDLYWQQITNSIIDFKGKRGELVEKLPSQGTLVCLHGKPRIFRAMSLIPWIYDYVKEAFPSKGIQKKVTVIIPYNIDRGYLKEAIASVPEGVQLIVSQGDGNWPENFNKVLDQAEGDYIKFLHEDDQLTETSIEDALRVFEVEGVDFIHGDAIMLSQETQAKTYWTSMISHPSFDELKNANTIHSATLMYRREIFDAIGGFNESLNSQEEYEFNLRCLKAGFKIGYCPKPLAIYRRHNKQKVKMLSKQERMKEKKQVLKEYEN